MSIAEVLIALGVGLVAGSFAGMLGVGGGIVMVPSMVLFLGQQQQIAQGTSLLVIVATASAGTVANARRGLLDVRAALLLGAGGICGAVAGSLLAVDVLDESVLRRVFGVVVLLVAARLVIRRRPAREDEGA